MTRPIILAAAAAALAALAWAFWPPSWQNDAGAALYAENCASCHGADLEGQPNWREANADGTLPAPPHDETGHTWHHDDAYLFDYTKHGGAAVLKAMGIDNVPSAMPGFADQMSDAFMPGVVGATYLF